LINKKGSKEVDQVVDLTHVEEINWDDESGCESCKL
jgi:hypothetical protein